VFILLRFMKFDETVNIFFKFHESQQNQHTAFKLRYEPYYQACILLRK
jgi:hypothetical protein